MHPRSTGGRVIAQHPDRPTAGPRGRATTFVRRNEPWVFPVVYVGWAYLWWSPVVRSGTSVWEGTNLALFLIGGASPLLAGIVLAGLTGGTASVHDLGRRLVDRSRITARWWLVISLFWLVLDLATAGAALVLGLVDRPLDPQGEVLTDPGGLLFLLVLSFVFPAVEEVGLRGYYVDRLHERLPLPAASLVNGVTWAVWHAPFVLLPGYYASTSFDPALWWWLPKIVCDAVLIVWVYQRTGRSILAALVFHALMNLTGELLGIANDLQPFLLLGSATAAATVLISLMRSPANQRGDASQAGGWILHR